MFPYRLHAGVRFFTGTITCRPKTPSIPITTTSNRFSAARENLSRFASSGGNDRRSLGRAISSYVRTSSGGAATAARRLAPSRTAAAGLATFLFSARSAGLGAALRRLNLNDLAGRPIQGVFLALTETLCPGGGTIDEAIARDAFIETIPVASTNPRPPRRAVESNCRAISRPYGPPRRRAHFSPPAEGTE